MKKYARGFGLIFSTMILSSCAVETVQSPNSSVTYSPEYSGYNVGYGYGTGEGFGGYSGFGTYVGYGGWTSSYYGPGYSSSGMSRHTSSGYPN